MIPKAYGRDCGGGSSVRLDRLTPFIDVKLSSRNDQQHRRCGHPLEHVPPLPLAFFRTGGEQRNSQDERRGKVFGEVLFGMKRGVPHFHQ